MRKFKLDKCNKYTNVLTQNILKRIACISFAGLTLFGLTSCSKNSKININEENTEVVDVIDYNNDAVEKFFVQSKTELSKYFNLVENCYLKNYSLFEKCQINDEYNDKIDELLLLLVNDWHKSFGIIDNKSTREGIILPYIMLQENLAGRKLDTSEIYATMQKSESDSEELSMGENKNIYIKSDGYNCTIAEEVLNGNLNAITLIGKESNNIVTEFKFNNDKSFINKENDELVLQIEGTMIENNDDINTQLTFKYGDKEITAWSTSDKIMELYNLIFSNLNNKDFDLKNFIEDNIEYFNETFCDDLEEILSIQKSK